MDSFIWNLSTKTAIDFLDTVRSRLQNVRYGVKYNWRHQVYTGNPITVSGYRIMRHHLVAMSLDMGNIHDDIDTAMMDYLLQNFQMNLNM